MKKRERKISMIKRNEYTTKLKRKEHVDSVCVPGKKRL